MPTARYWRMRVSSTFDGTYLSLKEVEFISPTGARVSVGGTPFASSEFSGPGGALLAFDQNLSTAWATSAGDFPAHIGYDHGAPVDVAYVRFLGNDPAQYPTSLAAVSIQWSDDGVVWVDPYRIALLDGELASDFWCVLGFWDGTIQNISAVGGGPFIASETPNGMLSMLFSESTVPYRDFEFGGFGRIAGTVKEDGSPDVPVRRRVRLHREQDGMLVREVWSDRVTGAYSFDYIDATKQYTVITYDYEHDYRAVIADNITPEVMP